MRTWTWALGMLLSGLLASGQQPSPDLRTSVSAVTIDVWAHDRQVPIGGLRAEDFVVRDNGLERADERPALMLLVTDGNDTASWTSAARVLDALRQTPAPVFIVTTARQDVTASPGESPYFTSRSWLAATAGDTLALLRLASRTTGGEVMHVTSTAGVGDAFAQILARYRHRYLLTFTIPESAEKGWHTIDVRLRTRRGTVLARTGYTVP